MPKAGYASITIQEPVYELAKKKADAEGSNIAALTEKAIRMYVESLQRLEDRARMVIKILQETEPAPPRQGVPRRDENGSSP